MKQLISVRLPMFIESTNIDLSQGRVTISQWCGGWVVYLEKRHRSLGQTAIHLHVCRRMQHVCCCCSCFYSNGYRNKRCPLPLAWPLIFLGFRTVLCSLRPERNTGELLLHGLRERDDKHGCVQEIQLLKECHWYGATISSQC